MRLPVTLDTYRLDNAMHATYSTYSDGSLTLAQCDGCKERHYFKSLYFARNWCNAHGSQDAHLMRSALKYRVS